MVRVRIAPSPTGAIHLGLVRSALYNWIFARHNNGKFILRIEDTDLTRSTEESSKAIVEGFKWLGIDWDEGPYFQSQRFPIYHKYAQKLLEENKAYYCYCPPERLEQERTQAAKARRSWKYDRRCLNLSPEDKKRLENSPRTVRFLIPDKTVIFNDIIHGTIEKRPQDLDDFICLRADGSPTYNFACVVDDAEMKISHVIRAVEHIANTPKQILLYEALGFSIPQFAHLPLILGPDRKKLSKRHGALSLFEYQKEGFLSEALINFLALLGWSPGGDREIISREEMVKEFSLERVNKSNAVFDIKKLQWMNGEYLRRSPDEHLYELLKPFDETIKDVEYNRVLRIIRLIKDRCQTILELANSSKIFILETITYDQDAVAKHLTPVTKDRLKLLKERFSKIGSFSALNLEQALRQLAQELNIKPAELIHPCRVAVTGKSVGPPLFDTLELIGKERVLKRLDITGSF